MVPPPSLIASVVVITALCAFAGNAQQASGCPFATRLAAATANLADIDVAASATPVVAVGCIVPPGTRVTFNVASGVDLELRSWQQSSGTGALHFRGLADPETSHNFTIRITGRSAIDTRGTAGSSAVTVVPEGAGTIEHVHVIVSGGSVVRGNRVACSLLAHTITHSSILVTDPETVCSADGRLAADPARGILAASVGIVSTDDVTLVRAGVRLSAGPGAEVSAFATPAGDDEQSASALGLLGLNAYLAVSDGLSIDVNGAIVTAAVALSPSGGNTWRGAAVAAGVLGRADNLRADDVSIGVRNTSTVVASGAGQLPSVAAGISTYRDRSGLDVRAERLRIHVSGRSSVHANATVGPTEKGECGVAAGVCLQASGTSTRAAWAKLGGAELVCEGGSTVETVTPPRAANYPLGAAMGVAFFVVTGSACEIDLARSSFHLRDGCTARVLRKSPAESAALRVYQSPAASTGVAGYAHLRVLSLSMRGATLTAEGGSIAEVVSVNTATPFSPFAALGVAVQNPSEAAHVDLSSSHIRLVGGSTARTFAMSESLASAAASAGVAIFTGGTASADVNLWGARFELRDNSSATVRTSGTEHVPTAVLGLAVASLTGSAHVTLGGSAAFEAVGASTASAQADVSSLAPTSCGGISINVKHTTVTAPNGTTSLSAGEGSTATAIVGSGQESPVAALGIAVVSQVVNVDIAGLEFAAVDRGTHVSARAAYRHPNGPSAGSVTDRNPVAAVGVSALSASGGALSVRIPWSTFRASSGANVSAISDVFAGEDSAVSAVGVAALKTQGAATVDVTGSVFDVLYGSRAAASGISDASPIAVAGVAAYASQGGDAVATLTDATLRCAENSTIHVDGSGGGTGKSPVAGLGVSLFGDNAGMTRTLFDNASVVASGCDIYVVQEKGASSPVAAVGIAQHSTGAVVALSSCQIYANRSNVTAVSVRASYSPAAAVGVAVFTYAGDATIFAYSTNITSVDSAVLSVTTAGSPTGKNSPAVAVGLSSGSLQEGAALAPKGLSILACGGRVTASACVDTATAVAVAARGDRIAPGSSGLPASATANPPTSPVLITARHVHVSTKRNAPAPWPQCAVAADSNLISVGSRFVSSTAAEVYIPHGIAIRVIGPGTRIEATDGVAAAASPFKGTWTSSDTGAAGSAAGKLAGYVLSSGGVAGGAVLAAEELAGWGATVPADGRLDGVAAVIGGDQVTIEGNAAIGGLTDGSVPTGLDAVAGVWGPAGAAIDGSAAACAHAPSRLRDLPPRSLGGGTPPRTPTATHDEHRTVTASVTHAASATGQGTSVTIATPAPPPPPPPPTLPPPAASATLAPPTTTVSAAPGGSPTQQAQTRTRSLSLAVAANGAAIAAGRRDDNLDAEPPAVVATKSVSVVAIVAVGSIIPGVGTSAGASAARIAATQGLGTCGRVEAPAYYALPMPDLAALVGGGGVSIADASSYRALACAVASAALCLAGARMLSNKHSAHQPEPQHTSSSSGSTAAASGMAQAVVTVIPAYVTPGVAAAAFMVLSAAAQPGLAARAADDAEAPTAASAGVSVAALAVPALLLASWLRLCLRHHHQRAHGTHEQPLLHPSAASPVSPPPPPDPRRRLDGLSAALLIAQFPPEGEEAAAVVPHPLRLFNFFVETGSASMVAAAAGVVVEASSALCVLRAVVATAVSVTFTAYVAVLRPLRTDRSADPLEHVFQLTAAVVQTAEAFVMLAAVAADWQGDGESYESLREVGEYGTIAALATFALGAVILAVRTMCARKSGPPPQHGLEAAESAVVAVGQRKSLAAAPAAEDSGGTSGGGGGGEGGGALLTVPEVPCRSTNPLQRAAAADDHEVVGDNINTPHRR